MGYGGKELTIKKIESDIRWVGAKNLILYDDYFEKPLMKATETFYAEKAKIWSRDNSCNEYIRKVADHLNKEEKNCDFMLQFETKAKIIHIIQTELIEKQAE